MSTEKPRPLQGYKESQETKREIPVDAKRFQQELSKVTESDESQQRGKRNLKKSEEEIEEEPITTPIKASGDLFSLFMSDKDSDTIMSPQAPQNVKATQAPTSSSKFHIEQSSSSAETPLEASLLAEEFSSAEFFAPTGTPSPSAAASSSSSSLEVDKTSPSSQPAASVSPSEPPQAPATTTKTEQAATTAPEGPGRLEKKEIHDTSLLAGKHPSAAQLAKKKKEKTPELKIERKAQEKPPADVKTTPKAPEKTPEKKPLPPLKTAKPPPSQMTTPQKVKPAVSQQAKEAYLQQKGVPHTEQKRQTPSVVDKKKIDKTLAGRSSTKGDPSSGTTTPSDSSKDHLKDQDKKEEKGTSAMGVQQVTPAVPFTTPVAAPAPIYATLHPQVYELFERMVGLMTLEQTKGITTTTVTINIKNSLFDGAKIVLEHYSTAPNAFNVTIAATPQAQELVNANINDLVAAFQQSKLSFEVNLRRPILLDEYQAFKRKEKTGQDEQKKQK